MKKSIIKILGAFSVVMMSFLVVALSCDGPSSGVSGNPQLALEIDANSSIAFRGGGTVYVDAKSLSLSLSKALSDSDDDNRGFEDLELSHVGRLFSIKYPDKKMALFFISLSHVTTNTLALGANNACVNSSESADTALAKRAEGGHCRTYDVNKNYLYFSHFLGTVFNNTDTSTYARGTMTCVQRLSGTEEVQYSTTDARRYPVALTDTTPFNAASYAECYLGIVNSGLGDNVRITEHWAQSSSSTKEVELFVIGIDIGGKTVSQFSDLPSLDEFGKELNNAALKRMIEKNKSRSIPLKVKIVDSEAFKNECSKWTEVGKSCGPYLRLR